MGCVEARGQSGPVVGLVAPSVNANHTPTPTGVDPEEILSIVLQTFDLPHLRVRPFTYPEYRGPSWRWSRVREGNWATLVYKPHLEFWRRASRVADRRSRAALSYGLPESHFRGALRRINRGHRAWQQGADHIWQHYPRVRLSLVRGGCEISRCPLTTALSLLTLRLSRE